MTNRSDIRVPVPPVDAEVLRIACEFCPVACRYRVFRWPVGREGGPSASENAMGVSYPMETEEGWISPHMHNVVTHNGELVNIVVQPDPTLSVVNTNGDHSIRGGILAQKFFNPDKPTAARLTVPMLRVQGQLMPISWDAAIEIYARVAQHVLDEYDELAFGIRLYSYQFFENTFAISKLGLAEIGTPNWAPHHAPAEGDDVPGLSDCGIDAFGSSFEDDALADVILLAGSDVYETKTVRYNQWMRDTPMIVVDPRRSFVSLKSEDLGGLHLQLQPGTDTALFNAIGREIIERGWEDSDFIAQHTASRSELDAEGSWRRKEFGLSFDEYRDYVFSNDAFSPEGAERATGVPADRIRRAAEMLAAPNADGGRKAVSIRFEKGLYWSHNYENTAAIGSLGVLLGAVGRPGRSTSRLGGHQRGGMKAAGYPTDKSPHEVNGHKIEMDTDRWFMEGNTRFLHVIGQNWIGAMAASQQLAEKARELTQPPGWTIRNAVPDVAVQALIDKIDNGGTMLVHQELYENPTTDYADLVLPAGGWGEDDYTRMNAERRILLYEKVADPPGQALSDWKIIALIAERMGFSGFDWPDTNAIFEESAPFSSGRKDYKAVLELAQSRGGRAHDVLKEFSEVGGLQLPAKLEGDSLVGTARLHEDLQFKSDSGKANFTLADWDAVAARNRILAPKAGQVWVLNGRVNALWNSLGDQKHMIYPMERYPVNFIEISPEDAAELGVESGDLLDISNDWVIDQLGQRRHGNFSAVAYVTDAVPAGVTYAYFNFPRQPANAVVSADTTLQPLNLRYNFKLGRGKITRIGATEYKTGFQMSFVPRNLV